MILHKVAKESSREVPRKRVARACDRCRLKKGKCDGKEQCAKCLSADVMCIYTDRKPPQHKQISPAVAEALQSENLTLKKASIIVFKQLVEAMGGDLPAIEGVDWESEKVASGKSGRALNYIISQQARVDNRISNEEIANYDSDTQMLDSSSSRACPDSPTSRQSSPHSVAGELSVNLWCPDDETVHQDNATGLHSSQHSPKFGGYPSNMGVRVAGLGGAMQASASSSGSYIDPNLLQPTGSIGSVSNLPPTPPTVVDSADYVPGGQVQWPNQQHRFYDERFLLQRCFDATQQQQQQQEPRGSNAPCDNTMAWVQPADLYPYFGEKELGKMFVGDAALYDRQM